MLPLRRPAPLALASARVLALALALAGTLTVTGAASPASYGAIPAVGSIGSVATAPDWYVKRKKKIGESRQGRAIRAYYRGDRDPRRVLVVLGQMHGDEPAGPKTAHWMRTVIQPMRGTAIWVVPTMNPDGAARGTRGNARGVDLNRNWPTSGWEGGPRDRYWGGPAPKSEPETKAMIKFLRKVKPDFIASIHQPLYAVGRTSGGQRWQERLAEQLDLPRKHLGVGTPSGKISPTMTGWYNDRFGEHGVAVTIEYGSSPTQKYVTKIAGRGIARASWIRPDPSEDDQKFE